MTLFRARGLARKRTHNLPYPSGRQQGSQPGLPIARIIIHYDQIFCPLVKQGVDQFLWLAGKAEATDHNASTVGNIGQSLSRAIENFGDHAYRSEEHTSELQSLMRISYAVFCL